MKVQSLLTALGVVFCYLIVQMLVQLSFSVLAIAMQLDTMNDIFKWLNNNVILIAIISNTLSVVLFVLLFKFKKRNTTKSIEFNILPAKKYIIPSLLTVSASILFAICTLSIESQQNIIIFESRLYFNSIAPYLGDILKLLSLLIFAPIAEEFIFRGIILKRLEKNFSPIVAILISGVVFGAIHFFAGGITLALGATFMGIIFGIIFAQTKSLILTIVAHAFANLPDFILPNLETLNEAIIVTMVIVCLVIFITSAFLMLKGKRYNTQ